MTFTHYSVDICLLADKPCTIALHISLLHLVDNKSVGNVVGGIVELKLPQQMFAAYANQSHFEDQSFFEQRVATAKLDHVLRMIDSVSESIILWMCMENNVDRASVVSV